MHIQDARKCTSVRVRQEDFRAEQIKHHRPSWLKQDVKQDAVHDDWRKEGECKRNETPTEQHYSCYNLNCLDQREHRASRRKSAGKLSSSFRHRRCGQEMEKTIEAKDEKHGTEGKADDQGD